MVGVTHVAAGMLCQSKLRKPWLYVPVALGLHGVMDASVVYHDFSRAWTAVLVLAALALGWLAVKRRLWQGAALSVVFDLFWLGNLLIGLDPGSIAPWNPHYWIQRYPPWNWHGMYGSWWGIPLEAGMLALFLAWAFGPVALSQETASIMAKATRRVRPVAVRGR